MWLTDLENASQELASLADMADQLAGQLDERCDKLTVAVVDVSASASNSWIGDQADLYFGDFEQASSGYDVDWGTLHTQEGWNRRTYEDVLARVEDLSSLRLAEVIEEAKAYRERVDGGRRILRIAMAPGNDREPFRDAAARADETAGFSWTTASQLISAWTPRNSVTRDMRAITQGVRAPAHSRIRASLDESKSSVAEGRRFLTEAGTLIDQTAQRLRSHPSERDAAMMERWVWFVRPADRAAHYIGKITPTPFLDWVERSPVARSLVVFGGIAGGVVAIVFLVTRAF